MKCPLLISHILIKKKNSRILGAPIVFSPTVEPFLALLFAALRVLCLLRGHAAKSSLEDTEQKVEVENLRKNCVLKMWCERDEGK